MLFRSPTATTEIYTEENTLSLHDALPIFDEIIVGLGADYAAEQEQDDAIDTLELKKETIDERIEGVQEEIAEVESETEQLEQRAQQMQQQQMQQMQQMQQQQEEDDE